MSFRLQQRECARALLSSVCTEGLSAEHKEDSRHTRRVYSCAVLLLFLALASFECARAVCSALVSREPEASLPASSRAPQPLEHSSIALYRSGSARPARSLRLVRSSREPSAASSTRRRE